MPVFLDTSVFLCAAGADAALREPCARVLREVAAGRLLALTSTEVVQELVYVLQRRQRLLDGIRLARGTMGLFAELLPVRQVEMVRACDLLSRWQMLRVRDAIHAATMLNHGISQIISADPHFDQLAEEGIHRISPETAA